MSNSYHSLSSSSSLCTLLDHPDLFLPTTPASIWQITNSSSSSSLSSSSESQSTANANATAASIVSATEYTSQFVNYTTEQLWGQIQQLIKQHDQDQSQQNHSNHSSSSSSSSASLSSTFPFISTIHKVVSTIEFCVTQFEEYMSPATTATSNSHSHSASDSSSSSSSSHSDSNSTTPTPTARSIDPMQHIAFSFNGGKDCTVLLHILRLTFEAIKQKNLHKRIQNNNDNNHSSSSHSSSPSTSSSPLSLSSLTCIYFKECDEFPSVTGFMSEMQQLYRFQLEEISSSDVSAGIRSLQSRQPIDAIFMGQRRGDPGCTSMSHKQLSDVDAGWTKFWRLNPLLEWSYEDVWIFLRIFKLPYCKLYEQGYTSLGQQKNTIQNPLLKIENHMCEQHAQNSNNNNNSHPHSHSHLQNDPHSVPSSSSSCSTCSCSCNTHFSDLPASAAASSTSTSASSAANHSPALHQHHSSGQSNNAHSHSHSHSHAQCRCHSHLHSHFHYRPAWQLQDGTQERAGRIKNNKTNHTNTDTTTTTTKHVQ